MDRTPLTSTWLTKHELRTPRVILDAFQDYWNAERVPRLERVVFRNDLTKQKALDLCLSTEGNVDIVTNVPPNQADRVQSSSFADLVRVKGNEIIAGVFNRFNIDVDFDSRQLRLAINLAVNRVKLVSEGFNGYADIVPALTPPWAFDFPEGLEAIPHLPEEARRLFPESAWPKGRPLVLATTTDYKKMTYLIADDLKKALNIEVNVFIIPDNQRIEWMTILAEKKLTPNWDILITSASALFLEGTPAFFHREFFGKDGALRASAIPPEFSRLYTRMTAQTEREQLLKAAEDIDRYVYNEVLALFLVSPESLYAVNKQVDFEPYRTTLEFAETSVTNQHWSRM
ncbi:ABC transporter substrate-binding protein [Virgibacillus necropolis]|uniref:ABC transporter substrate-binding protein n=1 Tax=Virgibacillus necropolis TaxID=163877 RepID=UPI00267BA14B